MGGGGYEEETGLNISQRISAATLVRVGPKLGERGGKGEEEVEKV